MLGRRLVGSENQANREIGSVQRSDNLAREHSSISLVLTAYSTLHQLLKLYDRASAEGPAGVHVPADIVYHFLLAVCTHPGQGICFRGRGCPRETEEGGVPDQEARSTRQKGAYTGEIHNKILANVLRALKVNEDPRQQELALKITAACPELVSGYVRLRFHGQPNVTGVCIRY